MSAGRLIVWRHGRTEWNRTDRMQGQADVALDDVGFRQARQAAEELASLDPAAIFSSDLRRAVQTAAALAELTSLEIKTDPALREIDVDDWEGRLLADLARELPDRVARLRAGLTEERRGTNGETIAEVADRFAGALRAIADTAGPADTVVIAAHGLAARVGICRFLGLPERYWQLLSGLSNCCWVSLLSGDHGWRIEEWNAGSLPAPVIGGDDQP